MKVAWSIWNRVAIPYLVLPWNEFFFVHSVQEMRMHQMPNRFDWRWQHTQMTISRKSIADILYNIDTNHLFLVSAKQSYILCILKIWEMSDLSDLWLFLFRVHLIVHALLSTHVTWLTLTWLKCSWIDNLCKTLSPSASMIVIIIIVITVSDHVLDAIIFKIMWQSNIRNKEEVELKLKDCLLSPCWGWKTTDQMIIEDGHTGTQLGTSHST